ncbi:MAG: rod shape-determining protein MreC [Calditrichaeota bacterium]|nr:rod shape-determining protein MreC [Calditrichota bacterium]
MTPLINLISRYHQSLLLTGYMILSFIFITSSDSKIVEGLRSSSLNIFGFIQENATAAGSYVNLRDENTRLRKENTALSYENFRLQDALLENIRLRRLLQFKYKVNYELIPAKVISYSPQDLVTGLILSSEEIHKAKKNAAVMTSEGLVGKIVKVTNDYAICQILFDPNSRVSAKVQRNRELGMIKWDGGNGLLLDHIPNTISILKGDVIFTSGFSKIYPADIKIGIVSNVKINNQNLFQEVYVTPEVNFNRLEEVLIYNEIEKNEPGN